MHNSEEGGERERSRRRSLFLRVSQSLVALGRKRTRKDAGDVHLNWFEVGDGHGERAVCVQFPSSSLPGGASGDTCGLSR